MAHISHESRFTCRFIVCCILQCGRGNETIICLFWVHFSPTYYFSLDSNKRREINSAILVIKSIKTQGKRLIVKDHQSNSNSNFWFCMGLMPWDVESPEPGRSFEFLVYHTCEMPKHPTTCPFPLNKKRIYFFNSSAALPTLGYWYLKSSTRLSHTILGELHGFNKKVEVTLRSSTHPPPSKQIKRTNNFSTIVSWHGVHNFWVFGDVNTIRTTSCPYCLSNFPCDWIKHHHSNLKNHRCCISGWEGEGVKNLAPHYVWF